MIAANIMSIDIVTVRSGDALGKALRLMNEKGALEIAVVDDESRVIGLVSPDMILNQTVAEEPVESAPEGRELPSPARRFFEQFRDVSSMYVQEVMERDVAKVGPETTIDEVAKILMTTEKRVACVAVVDDRGALLGIVTPLDVVRRLCEHVD